MREARSSDIPLAGEQAHRPLGMRYSYSRGLVELQGLGLQGEGRMSSGVAGHSFALGIVGLVVGLIGR